MSLPEKEFPTFDSLVADCAAGLSYEDQAVDVVRLRARNALKQCPHTGRKPEMATMVVNAVMAKLTYEWLLKKTTGIT